MSSTALLILVLSICGASLLIAFVLRVLGRLLMPFGSRRARQRRYSTELPTWGMMYREALARECSKSMNRGAGARKRKDSTPINVAGEPHQPFHGSPAIDAAP